MKRDSLARHWLAFLPEFTQVRVPNLMCRRELCGTSRSNGCHVLHVGAVRRLFSATVPDSSLARVRKVLVLHNEDEDDQENEKEDEREYGKQRVECRRESSNTQHERMDGMKSATHHEPMSMRD